MIVCCAHFSAFCALVCSPPVETDFPASAAFTHCAFCASLYGVCFILYTFPSPMLLFILICALFCIHLSTCQGRLSHWCRRWRSHNPWVHRVIVCQLCTSQQKHFQGQFHQLKVLPNKIYPESYAVKHLIKLNAKRSFADVS